MISPSDWSRKSLLLRMIFTHTCRPVASSGCRLLHLQRFWVAPSAHALCAWGDALPQGVAASPEPASLRWNALLMQPGAAPFASDHQVQSRCIFPGAGFLEMAAGCPRLMLGASNAALCAAVIPAPLMLAIGSRLIAIQRARTGAIELRSTDALVHLRGALVHSHSGCSRGGSGLQLALRARGSCAPGQHSEIRRPGTDAAGLAVHPAVLDAVFQQGVTHPAQIARILRPAGGNSALHTYVPAALAAYCILAPPRASGVIGELHREAYV